MSESDDQEIEEQVIAAQVVDEDDIEDQVMDEQMMDEQVIDKQVIDKQVIDEQIIDERIIDERIIDDRIIDERIIDENHITDDHNNQNGEHKPIVEAYEDSKDVYPTVYDHNWNQNIVTEYNEIHDEINDKSDMDIEDIANDVPPVENIVPEVTPKKKRTKIKVVEKNSELIKYWKAVRDNPYDFTGWTYLLQYVEQENELQDGREAFDEFLSLYPYCYGYWKKYSDMMKKNGFIDKATEVYERGLKAIPLSMDLWIHYITYMNELYESEQDIQERLRAIYERAISACGTDFRSDKLWEMYINWERDNRELKNVTTLYDRILCIPTQCYSHHFERFSQHVNENNPKEFLILDEFLKLRSEVAKTSQSHNEEDDEETPDEDTHAPPGIDDAPPGEDAPPGITSSMSQDKETRLIREKIIEQRRNVYINNEMEVSKRWNYEEQIRRPYFHVKPLEKSQLKNWKSYLDFEIENSTHDRAVVLFERCMIACALYEEMWMKYAKYMEPHCIVGARHVYNRACHIHLPKKPMINLAWAAFEEKQGEIDTAFEIFERLQSYVPDLLMVSLRKLSLHRRQRQFAQTEEMYSKLLENAENPATRSFYAIKYARYQLKIMDDREKAESILRDALQEDPENHKLYLQLVDLEYQSPALNINRMIELFDLAITSSSLTLEERLLFSQRKLEFLEDFGTSIQKIADTYDAHQKLSKESQAVKKRKAEEEVQNEAKKAKVAESEETTTNPAANGTNMNYTSTANGTNMNYTTQMQQSYADPNMAAYNYSQWPGYAGYNYGQHGWYNYQQPAQ